MFVPCCNARDETKYHNSLAIIGFIIRLLTIRYFDFSDLSVCFVFFFINNVSGAVSFSIVFVLWSSH